MSARKFISLIILVLSIDMLAALCTAAPGGSEVASAMTAPPDTAKSRKPRFSVRHTAVQDKKDLKERTADLRDPDNVSTTVTYDEKDDTYTVGTTLDNGQQTGSSRQGASAGRTPTTPAANQQRGGSQRSTTQSGSGSNSTVSVGTGVPGQSGMTLGVATSYLDAPILMSPEEYKAWSLRQSMQRYYRMKNREAFENAGHNKFDFTDMHVNTLQYKVLKF